MFICKFFFITNEWKKLTIQRSDFREEFHATVKILAKFCDVKEIVEEISVFHRNMYLINRTQIAEKLLKRMGNANIDNWQKDFQK